MNRFLFIILILLGLLSTFFCCGCTAYNRNSEGLRYFQQGRYDQAMLAFQASLNAESNNPDAYYNIAATFHQSAKVSQQMGQSAVAIQQFDQADQYYRLCLSRDANHTAAYRGLAVLYMERLNPEAAFNLLLGWSQSNPASPDPKIELARLYQEYAQICLLQGRTEDSQNCQNSAATLLQQALAVAPNNFRALRAMGYLLEQSNPAEAIAYYQRSLQANSSQSDLANRITVLSQGGAAAPINPYDPNAPGGATVYNPYNPSGSGASVYTPTTPANSVLGNPF